MALSYEENGYEIEDMNNIMSDKINSTDIENIDDFNIVDSMFKKLNDQFVNSQNIIKTLSINLKILQKEVIKERKEYIKILKKNKKNKKKSASGFSKPTSISEDLSEFLNLDKDVKIARTEVTKLLSKYIKDNNLQNPENKKQILLDEKMKKLFKCLDDVEYIEWFGMQKYLKDHFLK